MSWISVLSVTFCDFWQENKKGLQVTVNSCKPLCLIMEAAIRFELMNSGFADRCLTTWLCRRTKKNGAGNGI